MSRRIVVVGGGLAGIAAAIEAARDGAEVVLVERRSRLGGLTWSFDRKGLVFDNGQHVFLSCCTEYRSFLRSIGAADEVHLQRLLDVPVISPGGGRSRIARSAAPLPAPAHLGPSLLAYRYLSFKERVGAARAVVALRALSLDDPALDAQTFASWLARHGQSAAAIERLWDLVVLPTVNLSSAEASLALGAKVFRTGLLDSSNGGEVGWATVPLAELHGTNGLRALEHAGVEVLLGSTVRKLESGPSVVVDGGRSIGADAVIVALPHDAAESVLPAGTLGDVSRLGHSPIVNVHLVFDRKVTDLPFAAALFSPVQYVFDHTVQSGARPGDGRQVLVVSLSAATAWIGTPPSELVRTMHEALTGLFPRARGAALLDGVVSREHRATFRGGPGTAALRPGPVTKLPGVLLAGAWTDTGWPATMEGAVRSGIAAARAAASAAPTPSAGRRLEEAPA